jgi:site-specific recombinase XerD
MTMRSYSRFNRSLAKKYDQWMVAMHYAKNTQHIYRRTIQRYIEFMGERSIANADHADIRRYIARISEDGVSLGCVYRDLGTLRLFYDFLHLGGVAHYVAPRLVRLRRPWFSSPAPLSKSQVQQLLAATMTLRERALIEFFYGTGCRLGEVVRLKVEDIDFDTRIASVVGKLGKKRIVLLTRSAIEALRAYLGDRQKGVVFQQEMPLKRGCLTTHYGSWISLRSDRGRRWRKVLGRVDQLSSDAAKAKHEALLARHRPTRPFRTVSLSKMAVQQAVRRIADRAGIKHVSPHVFRHTFATHLFENGAGLEIVRTLLGHVWIHTTMKYARIGVDRMSEIFERCHPREQLNDQSSQ